MTNQMGALSLKRLIAVANVVFLSCVLTSTSATADTLADYDFATAITDPSTVTGVLSSTPSSEVFFGDGVDVVSTGLGNPARSLAFDSNPATTSSPVDLAAAIADEDYFAFTITPDAGTPLDLVRLKFDSQINFPGSVTDWTLFTDPDPNALGTQIATGTTAVPASPPVFETKVANLVVVPSLQNITNPVSFRLYFHGWTASSPLYRVDNLQLEGVLAGTGTFFPGDFDGDSDVDGADFLKWQRDGLSAADLLDWEVGYGISSSLSAALVTNVPEPSSLLLVVSAVGLLASARRKRK